MDDVKNGGGEETVGSLQNTLVPASRFSLINLIFPLVQQAIVLRLADMPLDGGESFQTVVYAMVAYWTGFCLIMARRRGKLTKTDRLLIRWGFLMLCMISPYITGMIWHLREYINSSLAPNIRATLK